MRRFIIISLLVMLVPVGLSAQVDRHDVRRGNRNFKKGSYAQADVDYRKARVRDSLSLAANYNLASNSYRQKNYEEAGAFLDGIEQIAAGTQYEADYWFNKGDIAIAKQDWQGAMDAFKKSLLLNPGDVEAKENYAYAKKMKQDEDENQDQNQDGEGGGDGGDNDQSQDNQDQDQNQDKQDRNQDQQQPQEQEAQISPQQAQQMLEAIQAKEQETQDKVDEKKAAALVGRQREKNW